MRSFGIVVQVMRSPDEEVTYIERQRESARERADHRRVDPEAMHVGNSRKSPLAWTLRASLLLLLLVSGHEGGYLAAKEQPGDEEGRAAADLGEFAGMAALLREYLAGRMQEPSRTHFSDSAASQISVAKRGEDEGTEDGFIAETKASSTSPASLTGALIGTVLIKRHVHHTPSRFSQLLMMGVDLPDFILNRNQPSLKNLQALRQRLFESGRRR
ncbi:hypothetical protein HPB50_005549 [Hyalomma asiaticum]|uniref:Uncharacterized protein n=1 Tax=Hyalomma asiaticum TaxID=266040 RepID=A0ACB7SNN7_HYAAI|nr:hypothetical protein HPB50_005549 [Hyalomma asiaticum]